MDPPLLLYDTPPLLLLQYPTAILLTDPLDRGNHYDLDDHRQPSYLHGPDPQESMPFKPVRSYIPRHVSVLIYLNAMAVSSSSI